MEKSNRVSLILLSVFMVLSHLKCTSQMTLQKCIEQEVRTILKSSNESYLSKNEDLVMLVNSSNTSEIVELKIALIHKDDYASFMRDKQMNQPRGYMLVDGLLTLFYGNLKEIKMLVFRDNLEFMKDNRRQVHIDGMPPLPPSTVEPEIFRYERKENCMMLMEKSMALDLF